MIDDIAIYGAGGFGREVACLLNWINKSETEQKWNFLGFFDDSLPKGTITPYGPVLGNMEDLNRWPRRICIVLCIGKQNVIKYLVEKITNAAVSYPNILAPDLVTLDVSSIRMGKGNIICGRSLLSLNIEIGDFNIMNGYITIGHDVNIGCYNIFMPGVRISGNITIGNNNFIGMDACLLQNIKVGSNVNIGAKSLVIRHAKDDTSYFGIPATKFIL
ncbi:MAG: serine acetyltransferase [Alistipes sp.]|nr:serine acetyltransferase [Alistipes sp.]